MPNNKIKVVHIVYSFELGGIESLLVEILNRLDRNLFDIYLIILTEDKNRMVGQLNDVEIRMLPYKYSTLVKGLKNTYPLLKSLADFIAEINPDIIHNHLDGLNFLNITLAMQLSGIKALHFRTIHTSGLMYAKEKSLRQRLKLYIDRIGMMTYKAHLIGISKLVHTNNHYYYKRGFLSNHLIYNGIDVNKFNPLNNTGNREQFNISNDKFIASYIARFSAGKNHKYLIDLWRDVVNQAPNALLFLAGDGPLLKDCKQQAKKLNLENNVIFSGVINNASELLAISDIAVFPSLFEGFSIVLLEKLAMGTPVILSDIAPFREIINDGEQGYLVPLSEKKQFTSAILRLFKNKDLRLSMGAKARSTARSFDINLTVKGYENIYLKYIKDEVKMPFKI